LIFKRYNVNILLILLEKLPIIAFNLKGINNMNFDFFEHEATQDKANDELPIKNATQSNSFEPLLTEQENKIEKIDGDIIRTEDEFPDETIFKTKQVAEFVNLNAQNLRNYMPDIESLLNLETDSNGTRLWKKANIKKLREILAIREQNGWSMKETGVRLSSPGYLVGRAMSDENALDALTKHINTTIQAQIQTELSSFTESLEQREKELVEQLSSKYDEIIKTNLATLSLPDNHEVLDEIREYHKNSELQLSNVISDYEKKITELTEQIQTDKAAEKQAQDDLLTQVNALKDKIEELSKPKKHWWNRSKKEPK